MSCEDDDEKLVANIQSDAHFLSYCELHAYSAVAKWRPGVLARLIHLASNSETADIAALPYEEMHAKQPKKTVPFDRDAIFGMVERARKKLRSVT